MKSIGGTLAGLVGVTGGASGAGTPKYVGLAYDPVTHKILGNARGKLTEGPGRLTGSLNIDGRVVSFNEQPSFAENVRNTESGPVGQQRYLKRLPVAGKPNQHSSVKVSSTENAGMTGYVRPPKGDKVAFAIGREGTNPITDIEEILEMTKPKNTEVRR